MDGIVWAASAMVAARTRLEIATQNLANVSSDGFRPIAARGFLTALGVTISRERLPERTGSIHLAGLGSNGVNAIAEMIDVLAAERAFESAQKAVTAIDAARQKSAEVARIK